MSDELLDALSLGDSKEIACAHKAAKIRADTDRIIERLVITDGCIEVLAEYVLGYPPRYFHKSMMDWQTSVQEGMLLAWRGSAKTSYCTIARCIFEILRNPNVRILLATDALDQGKTFLRSIKSHFMFNERFREIFGDWVKGSRAWSESEITVNRRTSHAGEPTIMCAGIGMTLPSRHFDIIICDDLVTKDNSTTEGQRKKVFDYFYETLFPTLESPDGKLWVLGCLTGDTRVLMGDGTWCDLVDICEGDQVWSYCEKSRRLVQRSVKAFIPQGDAEVLEIKTYRHTVKATPNHPFLVAERNDDGSFVSVWRRSDELSIGDILVAKGDVLRDTCLNAQDLKNVECCFKFFGRGIRLEEVREISTVGVQPVYDLTVEGTGNFIADGLIVHNTRWHEEDLYSYLQRRDYEETTLVIGALGGDDQSRWEEKHPTKRLHRIRTANLAAFELQYMCRSGIDLAIGQKSHHDFFAIAVIVVEKVTRIPYLVEYEKTRLTFPRQVIKIKELFKKHPDAVRIVIEANAFQAALVQQLRAKDPELPVIGRHTLKDKVARAQQVANMLTSRQLRVKREHDAFVRLMCGFPNVRGSKDVFDALEIALNQGMRGARRRRIKEPGLI
jgi:hypothetical protein